VTDYLKEYSSVLDIYSNVKQTIVKNHVSHYPVLDELLGFQYYLNKKFTEYHNSHSSEFDEFSSALSSYLLFFYNVQSLQSALNDIEYDRIHQAAVNLRTVYEAIPKMYYVSLFPEENEFVMVHEHIAVMPFENVVEELKGEECVKYLNGKELMFESKNELKKFKEKYTPNSIRKKLYSQKRHELIQNLYGVFSNSTHPNILRNRTSTSYEPKDTELFFDFLESLSYFNIQAYLEGNVEFLIKMGIHQEIVTFLNEKAKQLKSFYEDVYFFPDNENLDRKLITHIEMRTIAKYTVKILY